MPSPPRRTPGALLFLLLLAAAAGPARAQRDQAVGVFFDPGATARTRSILPLGAFDVFVITFNLDLPSKRFDVLAGFEVAVQLDPRLIVLDHTPFPYQTVEFTDSDAANDDNWIVGIDRCLSGQGTVRLLRYVTLLATEASNVVICLAPAEPATLRPPSPAWVDCAGTTHRLTYVRDLSPGLREGCGVVNPRDALPSASRTFSALKARFSASESARGNPQGRALTTTRSPRRRRPAG